MAKDASRLEDIAAIAVEFGNTKTYGELYDRLGPYIGGFSGLWGFVATVGDVFHDEALKLDVAAVWDKYDWPESIFATVEAVMTAAIEKPETVPSDNFSKAQREWARNLVRIV